jgi:hypothetical protein
VLDATIYLTGAAICGVIGFSTVKSIMKSYKEINKLGEQKEFLA